MTALESNTISLSLQAAKKVLDELKPIIDRLNIIYDSAGGVKETITQEELDAVASFSGLTKAQLDDGMFALTAVLRTDIANSYSALAQLAARA